MGDKYMGQDILRWYKCTKCNFQTTTTNKELIKCKVCGGDIKLTRTEFHDPNKGLRAIKQSEVLKKREKYNNLINTQPQPQYTPHCPTCGSPDVQKISRTKRWLTTGLFGLSSSDVGKTMCCRKCGYKW